MKKIISFLYRIAVGVAVFAAYIGVQPTSWAWNYQPEIPEEIK